MSAPAARRTPGRTGRARTTARTTARTATRVAATTAAAAVAALAASPAMAAGPVAQASATALEVTVASTPTDSGSYSVTNDGRRERATGTSSPAITALAGQDFVGAGTLAQDATTRIVGRDGRSAACAGLAGDGATVAAAGDSSCLTPGQNLTLDAASLDLTGVQLVQSDLLQGLDQQLQDALAPVLDQAFPALQDAVGQVLDAADLGVFLDAGAVQSRCTAAPGTADGTADLTDVSAYARVMGQRVDLVSLPVSPAPNTKVVTDLGEVAALLEQALQEQLTTALDGALGPLGDAIDQAAVVDEALATLGEQLAPLEENVLDLTLNKQVRPSDGAIEVTALDLAVLPVSSDFGVEVLGAQVGRSTCGPNGRVGAPPQTPDPTPTPQPTDVPTSVPAGVAESGATAGPDGGLGAGGTLALGGLLALAGAAGVTSWRRATRA